MKNIKQIVISTLFLAFLFTSCEDFEEVTKIQTNLITEKDYEKLQNKFENRFVNSNSSIQGIANSLADYYTLYGDTNLINTTIDIYRSISREEIKDVANKYLNKNQRLILEYMPENKKL